MTFTLDPSLNALELDNRISDGLEVTISWLPDMDKVLLTVADHKLGATFGVNVPKEKARDAFMHPFVYIQEVESPEVN